MMKNVCLVCMVYVLSGCFDQGTQLTSQEDFFRLAQEIFTTDLYESRGHGLSGGGDAIEYIAFFSAKDGSSEAVFDFSPMTRFLESQESFLGRASGGSAGSFWRERFESDERFILVDAVILQVGTIRFQYQEFIR